MPGALPIADPAPLDGRLPSSVAHGANSRNFGVYVHVPFCRVRCGYCDFNTYTAEELRGVGRSEYASHAIDEVALASRILVQAGMPQRVASTVYFGGGTPTMLPVADLAAILGAVVAAWGLAPDAEVTCEANPDSVDLDYLLALKAVGFTRVSFGMQSAVPRVLAALDRTHDPARLPAVVAWARTAGLRVSVDLIYGTPGETIDDWGASLDHALALEPDHISAYALIVEKGTQIARRIARGELAMPDDDAQADSYELADARLEAAGYTWYEVSNWARRPEAPLESAPDHRSRHNLAYWRGDDWWGVGAGAHSHVGGVRWWNVKHPAVYGQRVGAGASPAHGRETLDGKSRHVESVLLGARVRDQLGIAELSTSGRRAVAGLIDDGLLDAGTALRGTIRLTLRGRLLADAVVRRLLPD